MSRTVVAERHGFKVTWIEKKRFAVLHKWWHFFFRVTQAIVIMDSIKGKQYKRSRIWVTTCRKCDYKKLEARELWLPGQTIPEDTPDFNDRLEAVE